MFKTFFFLSHFFSFDDEYYNDGSRSGSSSTCPFPFSSANSIGRVSDSGSEMVKCSFPFFDGEMVNCRFPFFDDEMMNCCFPFCDGEMVNSFF